MCCGPEAGPPLARPRAEAGLSLVEMLVAAALSLSLAALALRAYVAGSALRSEVDAELRLQEGARYAFHVLGRSVHLAGFPGCLGESAANSPLSAGWRVPASVAPLEGWDSERPHPEFGAEVQSDAIALWWSVAACGADSAPELQPPVSDSAVPALRGNLFFIGRRGRDGDNPPALFVRDLSTFGDSRPARELVAGVESLRFRYQIGNSSTLLPANQVGNWMDVRSLRIELRLRSLLPHELQGEFSRTVSLRNRPLSGVDFPRSEWVEPQDPQGGGT